MKRFSIVLVLCFIPGFFSSTNAQTKKTTAPAKTVSPKKAAPAKSTAKVKKPVSKKDSAIQIRISTDSGVMIIKLYDSTPLHRNNFVKLVKEKFYDSLLFHRVIPGFMIQGGDPSSKNAPAGSMLGNGGDYLARIPAEFDTTLYHKKGVIAAARDGNPQKASSACQFYLVQGKLYTDDELNSLEIQKGYKYTAEQREMYKTNGGTASLDMEYTVFGEVISGVEVIAKIAAVPRDGRNRPLTDVRMNIEIIE